MINQKSLPLERVSGPEKLGTIGYLVIFAWSIGMVSLAPPESMLLVGGLCILVACLVYQRAFRRIFQLRWLIMIALLALPPIFFLGDLDRSIGGITYSSVGLENSLLIVVRVIVILVSVDGFTSSVDIACLAGLLERFGLRGLGFSMGVALNLLPALQTSAINTWHSLWMRGGLRAQRWRGLRLLLLTIITNALRRAGEIAIAAEGRAFCPDQCRAMPLHSGHLDRAILASALIMTPMLLLL